MTTFVTIGDKKFFKTIHINIQQIRHIYPHAGIIIGDIGFTNTQVNILNNIPYTHTVKIPTPKLTKEGLLFLLKPLFLLECSEPCVYMDGDTILLQPINELLNKNVDIVVTTRKHERPHSNINAGIFVLNNPEILYKWILKIVEEVKNNQSSWNEQDALNKLVENNEVTSHSVPCKIYNYTEVEKGIPRKVKILHLKSGRMNKEGVWETITPLLYE